VIAYPGGVAEALRIIARGGETENPALAKSFDVQYAGPTPF
jgi:hypothetical protein